MLPRVGSHPGLRLVGRAPWLVLLTVLAGCTAGAGTPVPTAPAGSFESPVVAMDPVLCDALDRVGKELRDVRETRLRRTQRDLLQRRFEDIRVMTDEVERIAPYELGPHLNVLWDMVWQLGLAVEDYRTTNQPAEAEGYIRRSITALQRALTRFRRAASCVTG
jgi:hypothetical protein